MIGMGKRRRSAKLMGNADSSDSGNPPTKRQRRAGMSQRRLSGDEDGDNIVFQQRTPPPTSDAEGDSSSVSTDYDSSAGAKRREISYVTAPKPAYPLSTYQTFETSTSATPEYEALCDLKEAHDKFYAHPAAKPDCIYFELNDFRIYKPKHAARGHGGELVALDRLLKHGDDCGYYLVDGTLSCGGTQHYVEGVPFGICTIDGYEDLDSFALASICLRSQHSQREDAWYRLGAPAPEYLRFYQPFLWLAQFGKCFVEFLLDSAEVGLGHFRADGPFAHWLCHSYGNSDAFLDWISMANLRDFRTTVAANVGYLWKECFSMDTMDRGAGLCKHPVWGEVDPVRLNAIHRQSGVETSTIVTPFVYSCFKEMYFASKMKPIHITNSTVFQQVRSLKVCLGLTPLGSTGDEHAPRTPESLSAESSPLKRGDLGKGDVVSVKPDAKSNWSLSDVWYAYVQGVRQDEDGDTVLDLIWLYQRCDTTLRNACYPFQNELFMSDNCNCGTAAWPLKNVIAKVDVEWHVKDPAAATGLFVRQKYLTIEDEGSYSFETLKQSDFECRCAHPVTEWEHCQKMYVEGDTLLVLHLTASCSFTCMGEFYRKGEDVCLDTTQLSEKGQQSLATRVDGRLEPAQIAAFDSESQTVQLQRFNFQSRTYAQAAPNELTRSDEQYSLPGSRLIRRCHVRSFDTDVIRERRVPAPYDRNGAADCFYTRKSMLSSDSVDPGSPSASNASKVSPPFNEGFDPTVPMPKLQGIGLFCGGGNFDRGLEDSGAVQFRYAVDWADKALHSYRANALDPDTHCFSGSVDDYLAAVMAGSTRRVLARVGAADFMDAGSPCPGFSDLQQNKYSDQSLKNASMVASVVSLVDIYSPKYFMLENVVAITKSMGRDRSENVFSQMLAALVALGYQVQQFLMDSWSYGSSQQRSRVFIVASAPGLEPLLPPPHTHDHASYRGFQDRSLGRFTNGQSFGKRRNDWAVFPHSSIASACSDLPDIADSQVQLCPSFPDHRTPTEEGGVSRTRIRMVPVRPEGMGLVQTWKAGSITGGEPLAYLQRLSGVKLLKHSTTYSRLWPDRLTPTLTTNLRIHDAVAGRTLHWDEHRSLTVMECRRAFGYLDHEVIVGSTAQQMKIIGNSVDRNVALALGMSLREAWSKSLARAAAEDTAVANAASASVPGFVSQAPTAVPSNEDAFVQGGQGAACDARKKGIGSEEEATMQGQLPRAHDQDMPEVGATSTFVEEQDALIEGYSLFADRASASPAPQAIAQTKRPVDSLEEGETVALRQQSRDGALLVGAIHDQIDEGTGDLPVRSHASPNSTEKGVQQHRRGSSLKLSDDQLQDVRAHGFEAILRILDASSPASGDVGDSGDNGNHGADGDRGDS